MGFAPSAPSASEEITTGLVRVMRIVQNGVWTIEYSLKYSTNSNTQIIIPGPIPSCNIHSLPVTSIHSDDWVLLFCSLRARPRVVSSIRLARPVVISASSSRQRQVLRSMPGQRPTQPRTASLFTPQTSAMRGQLGRLGGLGRRSVICSTQNGLRAQQKCQLCKLISLLTGVPSVAGHTRLLRCDVKVAVDQPKAAPREVRFQAFPSPLLPPIS